ncbi:MAG: helix-turn-helix domain-containing protein [Bacteroidota bacterium]
MSGKRVFDVDVQNQDMAARIVAGLERVAESFRVLLWDHAKATGLSPIQIQLLLFMRYHAEEWCNVSALAREFNMTKPTISDAVKMLNKKGLVRKIPSPTDGRAYNMQLTAAGEKVVEQTGAFGQPIFQIIDSFSQVEQQQFYRLLNQLIHRLNQAGVIQVQRSCRNCRYYRPSDGGHYCALLEMKLAEETLRLDCPEFEEKV